MMEILFFIGVTMICVGIFLVYQDLQTGKLLTYQNLHEVREKVRPH